MSKKIRTLKNLSEKEAQEVAELLRLELDQRQEEDAAIAARNRECERADFLEEHGLLN